MIIRADITKTIDEREVQKTTKEKQLKAKRSKGNRSFSEMVRAKWFCCAFKLRFVQVISKGSLIFKSDLELALSIVLKQSESCESNHVSEECRCLKLWDLLSILICSSILVLERRQEVATYLYPQLMKLLLISRNMNYSRKNLIKLFKGGLYFSIQPDKVWKSEIFATFQKINCSLLNNLKSKEAKSQIKARLSYLANSYFYNWKTSPRILRQYRVLRNLAKNKDIVITKPDKGNEVVILDRKLYNNTVEEIISDTSKFEKHNEDTTLKQEASLQRFLRKLKQKKLF